MSVRWTLEDLLGYIGTWSAVSHFRATRGIDPVTTLRARLVKSWGGSGSRQAISWPLAVLAGTTET
jgi:hypothetical protein